MAANPPPLRERTSPASPSPSAVSKILAARGVHKTYRLGRVLVPVLKGVTLEVREGEWVAILGASGSGKSTLLHLLGGLDRPDKKYMVCPACGTSLRKVRGDACPSCRAKTGACGGEVIFKDKALEKMSTRELDRYRASSVGFVFQFYHLLPELNVMENVLIAAMVRLGRLGYWRRRGEVQDSAKTLLASFGLGARLKHRPAELSGGERQRVAIARALINDPVVLLADEPTGNLDHKTGGAILDAVAGHRKQTGRTIVMVTHDQEVAARADRIVRLADGLMSV